MDVNREYRRGLEDGLELFKKHLHNSKKICVPCKRKIGVVFNKISGSIKKKKLETIERELRLARAS